MGQGKLVFWHSINLESNLIRLFGEVDSSTRLLQLLVLRLGFFQDGDVGVGVLPEG
jgi:hypothetical protein